MKKSPKLDNVKKIKNVSILFISPHSSVGRARPW